MGDVINLRRARKRNARDAARRRADEATARTDATAADAARRRAERALDARRHEAHRRDDGDSDGAE